MKRFFLYFLPHERNNHRAILLQPFSLALLIGLYLLNQASIRTIAYLNPGVLGYSSEITIQKIYNLTNNERKKSNLPALHYNEILAQSAALKAQDMFKNNYWAHNSPQGKTPWEFFKSSGYDYQIAGENLAKDFYDSEGVLRAWMNSPTHKANIVSSKYQEIGVAVVNGTLNGIKTTLVVQHFGTPLNPTKISINNPIEREYYSATQPSSKVLSASKSETTINPLVFSKTISLILFVLIISVLIIDSYITLKNQTHRLTGSATGHIGFLMIIFVLLIVSQQGRIF